MENEVLEQLMYESGITAQGCWDQFDDYDRRAIMTLAGLVVRECIKACESTRDLAWTTPLKQDEQVTACVLAIKNHFGDDSGSI